MFVIQNYYFRLDSMFSFSFCSVCSFCLPVINLSWMILLITDDIFVAVIDMIAGFHYVFAASLCDIVQIVSVYVLCALSNNSISHFINNIQLGLLNIKWKGNNHKKILYNFTAVFIGKLCLLWSNAFDETLILI